MINGQSLSFVQVSDQVNSVRNQGLQCILPKPEYEKLQHAKGLGRFFKTASEVIKKEEESKRNIKEHIREVREEESKRVEAVVNTATMYGSRKKDTLD